VGGLGHRRDGPRAARDPGLHVGFRASSRDAVDAFWRPGIDAGYQDDGAPARARSTAWTTTAASCSTPTATARPDRRQRTGEPASAGRRGRDDLAQRDRSHHHWRPPYAGRPHRQGGVIAVALSRCDAYVDGWVSAGCGCARAPRSSRAACRTTRAPRARAAFKRPSGTGHEPSNGHLGTRRGHCSPAREVVVMARRRPEPHVVRTAYGLACEASNFSALVNEWRFPCRYESRFVHIHGSILSRRTSALGHASADTRCWARGRPRVSFLVLTPRPLEVLYRAAGDRTKEMARCGSRTTA
jgi:hypothetical protein